MHASCPLVPQDAFTSSTSSNTVPTIASLPANVPLLAAICRAAFKASISSWVVAPEYDVLQPPAGGVTVPPPTVPPSPAQAIQSARVLLTAAPTLTTSVVAWW